jgi:chemotaxis protein histidine kinase CheA
MTPLDAAKLLELPTDATPEQLEARFLELRTRLEDKIAKAPTPGLKAKYRESLEQVTAAFEALTLAADSSALPVLRKSAVAGVADPGIGNGKSPGSATPATAPQSAVRTPQSGRKSSKEFLVVALIAVAVLAAGGWFVMKTRAEKAEQVRLEAEAKTAAETKVAAEKAEQARLAEAARIATEQARAEAEAKRQAEEAEKTRLAAEEKARQEKQVQQAATLRAALAEFKILWDATEQEARATERRVAELRSEARALGTSTPDARRVQAELAAHLMFSEWLNSQLLRHPARVARAQAEELLSARQLDEAAAALQKAVEGQRQFEHAIAATRTSLLTITGSFKLVVPDEAAWELVDAYGQKFTGRGPATLTDRPIGEVQIRVTHGTFPPREHKGRVRADEPAVFAFEFAAPKIKLQSHPAGANILINGKLTSDKTPAVITMAGPGTAKIELNLPGHDTVSFDVTFAEGDNLDRHAMLRNDQSGLLGLGYERNEAKEMVVTGTSPNSPAAEAGLVKGTVLVAIKDGERFVEVKGLEPFHFSKLVAGDPGQVLTLRVRASGATETRDVNLTRISRTEIARRARPIAEVHLLRPARFIGGGAPMYVYIDGKKYFLGLKDRVVVSVPVGDFTFEAGFWGGRDSFTVNPRAGENYFELDPTHGNLSVFPRAAAVGNDTVDKYEIKARIDLSSAK